VVALDRERPAAQVREERRRDRPVVLDEIALAQADLGPVDAIEMGELDGPARHVAEGFPPERLRSTFAP
jgi:hypothetical protein